MFPDNQFTIIINLTFFILLLANEIVIKYIQMDYDNIVFPVSINLCFPIINKKSKKGNITNLERKNPAYNNS
jgi:hypothetical protein